MENPIKIDDLGVNTHIIYVFSIVYAFAPNCQLCGRLLVLLEMDFRWRVKGYPSHGAGLPLRKIGL